MESIKVSKNSFNGKKETLVLLIIVVLLLPLIGKFQYIPIIIFFILTYLIDKSLTKIVYCLTIKNNGVEIKYIHLLKHKVDFFSLASLYAEKSSERKFRAPLFRAYNLYNNGKLVFQINNHHGFKTIQLDAFFKSLIEKCPEKVKIV